MYLIVGLGNPEPEYSKTRHNMGFDVINRIANKYDIEDSVFEIANFYKVPLENIIVIYDDIDINPGVAKIRKKGGPGTHNGMKSVVYRLGSQEFPRIRVGTGMPEYKNDLINYVISKVNNEDYIELEKGIDTAADAVVEILKQGIDNAMNKIN